MTPPKLSPLVRTLCCRRKTFANHQNSDCLPATITRVPMVDKPQYFITYAIQNLSNELSNGIECAT